jgi:multisubunit Na+/H+ antiporter MnhB subunit
MSEYIYLIAASGLGILLAVVLYAYQRRRAKNDVGHTWVSYVLCWPLILDADKSKRKGRVLTTREWIGWGLVVLIVVLAVVLTPSRR